MCLFVGESLGLSAFEGNASGGQGLHPADA